MTQVPDKYSDGQKEGKLFYTNLMKIHLSFLSMSKSFSSTQPIHIDTKLSFKGTSIEVFHGIKKVDDKRCLGVSDWFSPSAPVPLSMWGVSTGQAMSPGMVITSELTIINYHQPPVSNFHLCLMLTYFRLLQQSS